MTQSRLIRNSDNTVTDTQTGLIWSHTIAKNKNHADAAQAVAELGEGWRLPTVEELALLADRTKHNPAIDTDFFPDTENDWYWTSTPCAWSSTAVWVVSFHYGAVSLRRGYLVACVRAVRCSQ